MADLTLPDAPWRHRPGLDRLLAALGAGAGETRFVGGAVRDTLLGLPVADLDLATRLRPEAVRDRIRAAGLKAVPTGLAHGTITAVLADGPVEVTTLRRDVSTDGRRATVAFSDDWREDAARRDFTINALYADPASGALFDYFGGADDLTARRVRFIGDPLTRIAEDHLRILRFFRFHARFGGGAPDAEGYAACAARANDLMALSRERIADELLKMLAGHDPATPIGLMRDRAILTPVLPEIDGAGEQRLAALVAAEAAASIAPDRIRRLIALLPGDPAVADAILARLKLSNAIRKRAALVLAPCAETAPDRIGYRLGREAAIDRLLIAGRTEEASALGDWQRPTLPISGGALVARGLSAGPAVARALRRIEEQWVAEGFPDTARVAAIADAVVRRTAE
ncbi:CCA tRNA nucleotidyltransferase [Sphingomonas flavalba]|uniref:CCA tRNA nucleotidyltransferase n=1 Tax=Sphingomonas flavalba TaxID=2559804 RepID=UPI00109DF0C7|nr:CCA tRNA nucleotidyltransferase [Sphingomonas flavalba]